MATLTPSPKMQFFDANGAPLVGGKLYTYAAGTTTPLATYTDSGAGTPNANPVILDSRGEASVWLGTSLYYMELKTSADVLVWTSDNIGGVATLSALAASGGSALVGFIQAGAGAVARTAQAKMRDFVSVKDFGAVGDGVNDDTAEIQAAIDAAYYVFFPAGNYKTTSALTLRAGTHLYGESYLSTRISVTGAINGLVASFVSQTEAGIVIDNLRIIGQDGITQDLLSFTRATAVTISDCNIRATAKSCVRMDDNCINYLFSRVRFENFAEYGVYGTTFSSVVVFNACQWDANAVNGIAAFNMSGSESWTFIGCNVNGNSRIGFQRGSATRLTVIGTYAEGLDAPAFFTLGTELIDTLEVIGGLFASSDSIKLADLNNAQVHRRISFKYTRVGTFSGAGSAFSPGSTSEFEFLNCSMDGTPASQVVGYTSAGSVCKNPTSDPKIKRYTGSTGGLAPGGTAQITLSVSTDFPAANYNFGFAIEVVGGGENGQNKNQMSYRLDDVTTTSIVFTITRDAAGASFQTGIYYVSVFGIAK